MSAPGKFPPRVRFNWGFHDGAGEAQWGRVRDVSRHFDSIYADGYRRGVDTWRAARVRPESSEPAWQERLAEGEARRAIRAMRPETRQVRI